MSQMIIFDTYDSVKRLKAVGFTEEQAEAQTRIISDLVDEQLVTRAFLDERLKELENRLTIRLGKMLAWSTGLTIVVLGAMIKLL